MVFVLSPLAWAQDPSAELTRVLAEAQRLLDQGRTMEALEVLEQAAELATDLEVRNLVLQEEVLWQAAMSNLDFAQELTNQTQYRIYAQRARDLWKAYIEWYADLSPEERKQLPRRNRRIEAATRHLGNANVRSEDLANVFADYADIPEAAFLGTEALRLWKSILYRCPDWRPVEQTGALRREKICSEECGEEWLTYADVLKEWSTASQAGPASKRSASRETEEITRVADSCETP